MYTWFSNFNSVTIALQVNGTKLVAWPYVGASYGFKWAIFTPRKLQ